MGIQNTPLVFSSHGVSLDDIQSLSKLQTNYKGHKGEFFEVNPLEIQSCVSLLQSHNIDTIIDQFSGGGTYGLSWSKLLPSVKLIVLNEISPLRRKLLTNNLKYGSQWMDTFIHDDEIEKIMEVSRELRKGYESFNPVVDSFKEGIYLDTNKPLKWDGLKRQIYEMVKVLNEDKKVFLLSLCDSSSSMKMSMDNLIKKSQYNSDIVRQHSSDFLSRGGTIKIVSCDSLSSEMDDLCEKHRNSLILSDPPYHSASKGCYKTDGVSLDFHSIEFVEYHLSVLERQSRGNFLIYHNKQTLEVIDRMNQSFYGRLRVIFWNRKVRGDRLDCSEVLGVFNGLKSYSMKLLSFTDSNPLKSLLMVS